MFSLSSLAASTVGVVALIASLAAVALMGASPATLNMVFTIADLVGFLTGAIARHSTAGLVGMHLSWVPLVVVLAVLAAVNPNRAADLIKTVAGTMLDIATGLGQVLVLVFT